MKFSKKVFLGLAFPKKNPGMFSVISMILITSSLIFFLFTSLFNIFQQNLCWPLSLMMLRSFSLMMRR